MLVLLEPKKAIISFSMNRFYQGDWIDSIASRFIEELPGDNLEKTHFLTITRTHLMNLSSIKILN